MPHNGRSVFFGGALGAWEVARGLPDPSTQHAGAPRGDADAEDGVVMAGGRDENRGRVTPRRHITVGRRAVGSRWGVSGGGS